MTTELALPATLLAHADFLRRLARSLTAHDSDDLAQDTWLAALQHPPRVHGNARAWLATVAGNVLRNRRRTETRRSATERAAMAERTVPTPDQIAQREEVRRRVVAAVLQLPAELRDVVLLSYWEGLDSTAIGRRLARPAGTVRWQVREALERLRRRLDAQHGEQRTAWAVPLSALCQGVDQPMGVPLGWSVRAMVLATGAVLLIGVAWLVLTPGPVAETEALAPSDVTIAEIRTGDEKDAAAQRKPTLAAAPSLTASAAPGYVGERPRGSIAVKVLDAATRIGVPASVALRSVPDAQPADMISLDERDVTRHERADHAGTVLFEDLPVGDYEVEAQADAQRAAWRKLTVVPGETSCTVELPPTDWRRGMVIVKVVDAGGRGVVDAQVCVMATCTRRGAIGWNNVPAIEGQTDARGVFRFADTMRLELMFEGLVTARTADRRVGSRVIDRPEHRGYSPTVQVIVDRPGTLAGRVVGLSEPDTKTAVIEARPTLVYGGVLRDPATGTMSVAVDERGAFRLAGLPAGYYQVALVNTRDACLGLPVDEFHGEPRLPTVKLDAGATTELELPTVAAALVRGRVVDEAGAAVAGATVGIRRHQGAADLTHLYWPLTGHDVTNLPPEQRTTTGADGRYELCAVQPLTHDVLVQAPGRSFDLEAGIVLQPGAVCELEHRVGAAGAIRGLAADGTTVAVRASVGGPLHLLALDRGSFALGDVPVGRYEVGLWTGDHSGFVVLDTVDVAAGRAAWTDLRQAEPTVLVGVILVNGEPLADLDVFCESYRTRTASDGSFALTVSRPHARVWGSGRLGIAWQGCVLDWQPLPELPVGQLSLGSIAVVARRLDVRLLEGTEPAPGSVRLCSNLDSTANAHLAAPEGVVHAWVPPGHVNVIAHFADGATLHHELDVGDRDPPAVTLQQPSGGSVSVEVLDTDGAAVIDKGVTAVAWGRDANPPADGAAFVANRDQSLPPQNARTDGDGKATLRRLRPGPVLVYFAGGSWSPHQYGRRTNDMFDTGPPPAERIVFVRAGETVAVQLALPK